MSLHVPGEEPMMPLAKPVKKSVTRFADMKAVKKADQKVSTHYAKALADLAK